jgi:TonB family protein
MTRILRTFAVCCAICIGASVHAQDQSPTAPPANAAGPDKQALPPSTQRRAMRIRVSWKVQQANLTQRVDPVYPKIAEQANVAGTVVLHIVVGTDGAVSQCDTLSGPSMLIDAAADAIRKSRFRPTRLNGDPVEVDTTVGVLFQVDHKPRTSFVD